MKAHPIIVLLLAAAIALTVGAAPCQAKAPNFIQILTDDQGRGDLKSFGHDRIISPHIDRLAPPPSPGSEPPCDPAWKRKFLATINY